MKKNFISITKIQSSILLILSLIMVGCVTDETDNFMDSRNKLAFKLDISGEHYTKSKRYNDLTVKYILANSSGHIVKDIQSDYHPNSSTIVIEPLPLGTYNMFVLAYSDELLKSGFEVNEKISSTNEAWCSFTGDGIPLITSEELFFGKTEFTVNTELSFNQTINLSYVLAGIDIEKNISSPYLKSSIQDINFIVPESASFYTSITVDGVLKGQSSARKENQSLKNINALFVMPQVNRDSIMVSFKTTTKNHSGDMFQMTNTASVLLQRGAKSNVSLDLDKHPDGKTGMLFINQESYELQAQDLILQDDESKHVYYDYDQRSFRINKLLQLSKISELKLQTRFYSPVAIKNVSIWSSAAKYGERVLLAYYDSIPAFSNAKFEFAHNMPMQEFELESKSKITLTKSQINELLEMELEVECNDPYWLKIKTIKPEWLIRFASFGGDPDAPNGAPAGNWMGIRPVHIREAIAFMINLGYMLSTEEFAKYLETFQGQIWGNGGREDILDVKTIIPQAIARPGFTIGLVYSGNGVAGLGGGWTFGVYQPSYFHHYFSPYAVSILMHELGHCMGYSHNSGMSSGPWAEKIANTFYVNNISKFPVNNLEILNSEKNPNKY